MTRTPIVAALTMLLAGVAFADEPATATRPRDGSLVDGHGGAALQGVAGINLAAGSGNAQANVRVIALAPGGAVASARQTLDASRADAQRDASAVLAGSAFDAVQGISGINQAAGSANAQLNVLAIGPGVALAIGQQVDNLALAATHVDAGMYPTTSAVPAPPRREARVDGTALRAPSGVVQLNQTAGVGNASVNAIVLQLPGGTP